MQNKKVRVMAYMALFIALSYIGTLFNITFYLGPAKTMVHLGNVFALLGGLVLGGVNGGIAASIGMGLFDLTNGWIPYAPSTFILKFFIAFITAFTFKRLKVKNFTLKVVLANASGMLFNFIAAPIASYFTTRYILKAGAEASMIFAKYESIPVLLNAVIATVVASILYLLLKPVIKNINLFK